jgi:hypothetical protein
MKTPSLTTRPGYVVRDSAAPFAVYRGRCTGALDAVNERIADRIANPNAETGSGGLIVVEEAVVSPASLALLARAA